MVGSGRPLLAESSLEADLAARVRHPLEQVEGALKGLDATAGGGGLGGGDFAGASLALDVGTARSFRCWRARKQPTVRFFAQGLARRAVVAGQGAFVRVSAGLSRDPSAHALCVATFWSAEF